MPLTCQKTALDKVQTTDIIGRMKRGLDEITEEALALPQSDQLRLARILMERVEASGDVEAVAAWEKEIERRIQSIDAGRAKGRPFSDVILDIDRRFRK